MASWAGQAGLQVKHENTGPEGRLIIVCGVVGGTVDLGLSQLSRDR